MTDECGAHTFPYIECKNSTAKIEHEATTLKLVKTKYFTANKEESAVKKQSV